MPRPKVSAEARALAIRAVRERGRTVTDVARELGVARATLNSWIVQIDKRPALEDALRDAPLESNPAPTIIDVARAAGLSKSVVSRALAGSYGVSASARERVQEAATSLGYVHNAMAQGLSSHRTFTLGVLVRDASAPIYGHTQTALQARASERGYRVITTTGTGTVDLADERAALQELIRLRVEGLVVCSGPLPADDIVASVGRTPVVVAGRVEHDARLNSVFADETAGVNALADHLAALGHRRVAVPVVASQVSQVLAARSELCQIAINSIPATAVSIPCGSVEDAPSIFERARAEGCTAICAPNDRYLLALLEEARNAGALIPDEMSMTGFDGIPPYTSPYLGLTTWAQPITAIGSQAVDRLLQLVNSPAESATHQAVSGKLLVGRTTAPPPK